MLDFQVKVPEGRSGPWRVERFVVADNDSKALYYALHGRPIPPGVYTRLMRNGDYDPVMSDTPAELRDHLDFIYRAKGRVLVNGLGLGVVLVGLLTKPEVSHIDVVEIEADVISLVWPTYTQEPRLTLFHANAFTLKWPPGARWDYIWHDIWPTICTDNLPEITRLKRKYAKSAGWQGAWLEETLRSLKRQGR